LIALYIIGAILLIIAGVLFLPISAVIKWGDKLYAVFKFSGITLYKFKEKSKTEKPESEEAKPKPKEKKATKSKLSVFYKKTKDKYGLSQTIKLISGFLKDLFSHIKTLLKHIEFKKIVLDITVAEGDAAKTAIEYGGVCAVVYPLLAELGTIADIKYKSINISSDFNSNEGRISFEGAIKTRIFYLLIVLFKVYSEYKKFIARIEDNERK
jgi:hypothetical protein